MSTASKSGGQHERASAALVTSELSPAAAKAIDLDPREIVARWLAGLAAGSRTIYARALKSFTAWAVPAATDPEEGLRVLCRAGAAGSFGLLIGWRDSMPTLAPNTVASYVSAITSLLRVARRCGLIDFVVDGVAPMRERVQDRSGPAVRDVEDMVKKIDNAAATGDRQEVRGIDDGPLFFRTDRDVDVQQRRQLLGGALAGLVGAWARKACIKGTVRCHGLRHSSASEAARRGSLAELQALGAWKSLSAASHYLDERQDVRRRALALVDL